MVIFHEPGLPLLLQLSPAFGEVEGAIWEEEKPENLDIFLCGTDRPDMQKVWQWGILLSVFLQGSAQKNKKKLFQLFLQQNQQQWNSQIQTLSTQKAVRTR